MLSTISTVRLGRFCALLSFLISGIAPLGLLPANAVTITEFPVPTADSYPSDITAGPDGNLWFTEASGNKIGRITTAGVITEFPVPTADSYPSGIAAGPDGNLWFTEASGNKIGRITTAGVITEFPVPTADSYPSGIATGPDGNLWFTEASGNKIGRITTAGVITEFPVPTADSYPLGITAGPDGNLWFTEASGNKIGRITTDGVITEFPVPTPESQLWGITAVPDGNLWFTEWNGNKIGRITTAGVITEFPVPTADSYPLGITAGPDGNLWFTEWNGNKIGRITTAGVITEFPVPTADSYPSDITAGPDGNLWFTERESGKLGQLIIKPDLAVYQPSQWTDKILVSNATGTGIDVKPLYGTDNLYVSFAVINKGAVGVTKRFMIELYADSELKGQWNGPSLDPNKMLKVVDYSIGRLSSRDHNIILYIDLNDAIDESNKEDNQYAKLISILPSDKANVMFYQPDPWDDMLIVSTKKGAITDGLLLKPTNQLYLGWGVKNYGKAQTDTKVTVALYVDGAFKKNYYSKKLLGGYGDKTPYYKTSEVLGKLPAGVHELRLEVVDSGDKVSKEIVVQSQSGSVTRPNLEGPGNLKPNETATFTAGDAVCDKGEAVQYYFDWGDEANTGWLAVGAVSGSHLWDSGYYEVKAIARCSQSTKLLSDWQIQSVTVSNAEIYDSSSD